MVESKCLVSRAIALHASAQLNKWNLQLSFLDFRKKIFDKYFLEIFFKVFKVEKPYFFVRRPKRILVIIIFCHGLIRDFLSYLSTDFCEIFRKNVFW